MTPPICLAINNIDYVLEFIKPFVTEELGTEETLERLERTSGRVVAASCRRTLSTLIVNTVENVENKILEVLDVIGERVCANSTYIQGPAKMPFPGCENLPGKFRQMK